MADHSLAHRAQNATRTETIHQPPTTAPTNHGRTLAAWTTTWTVVLGGVVAGVGVALTIAWLLWVGVAVMVGGLVLGKVLQLLGHGQGGAATLEREKRRGGH